MLTIGSTFIWDGHVWFILSDPAKNGGKVLCVNITTLDEQCCDDECVLSDGDYSWIEPGHKSAIAFSRAKTWDVQKIEAAIKQGILKCPHQGPVPSATVSKVAKVGMNSRELSKNLKSYLT